MAKRKKKWSLVHSKLHWVTVSPKKVWTHCCIHTNNLHTAVYRYYCGSILSLDNFNFLCVVLIIIHFHTPKNRKNLNWSIKKKINIPSMYGQKEKKWSLAHSKLHWVTVSPKKVWTLCWILPFAPPATGTYPSPLPPQACHST